MVRARLLEVVACCTAIGWRIGRVVTELDFSMDDESAGQGLGVLICTGTL